MDELLADLRIQLDALGVTVAVESITPAHGGTGRARARLSRGGSTQTYALVYGRTITLTEATSADAQYPMLVFTTFVAPRTADAFRRAEVQYLDTAGNAWIKFGEVYIDVRGRPRPERTPIRARAKGNLFSRGQAQVVFVLLAWPELWEAPQREVAHVAGVSLGHANNTLMLLAEAGYGRHDARAGRADLLDLWAAAFPTGLAQRLTLATYRGEIGSVKPVAADAAFISGESAATGLLRPTSLTLYVDDLDPRLPITNRWRTDEEPNIVVRRKFWHAPGEAPERGGVQIAPWPLVYADLLASDDPRVRGAAKEWRDQYARAGNHA